MGSKHRSQSWRLTYFLILFSVFTSGCSTVGYIWQAGRGQLSLMNQARPIEDVLKDPREAPRVKRMLASIDGIKSYVESRGLKRTHNYQEYVKLDREAVSYVVTASDPLKFEPKLWSFPVVGSFSYLGYFSVEPARALAEELRAQGYDVDVRGAQAYSTLGWFKDPVLSSMLPETDDEIGGLVNVVIHESVHATVYIPGQTSFNESLASFVADKMTPDYLASKFGEQSVELKKYAEDDHARDQRVHLFVNAYQELEGVYTSAATKESKLAQKEKILKQLSEAVQAKRPLNNAVLLGFKTYGTGEKEFGVLYEKCGRDLGRFMKRVGGIDGKSFKDSQQSEFGPVILALAGEC